MLKLVSILVHLRLYQTLRKMCLEKVATGTISEDFTPQKDPGC